MKQEIIHKRQMLILLGIMAVLSWITYHILFRAHTAEELRSAFAAADRRFVLAGAACMAVYLLCETESIRVLMKAFQTRIPFWRGIGYSFADFYFSAITPSATGGQPMQLYYMTRDGFLLSQSSFALLLLAAVYQLAVLLCGAVMILWKFPYVQSQERLIHWLLIFGVAVNGIGSAGILLVILRKSFVERLAMAATAVLSKLRIIRNRGRMERRVEHLIDEYSRGGDWLRRYPAVFLKVLALTVLRLTALFLVPYFACKALGFQAAGGPLEFIALQAILSLAVTAVPLPGSVGASEGAFLLLYTGIFTAKEAFPLMMLSRGISFYGFLAVSGTATLILQFWRPMRPGTAGE